jgi:hypothetical protein
LDFLLAAIGIIYPMAKKQLIQLVCFIFQISFKCIPLFCTCVIRLMIRLVVSVLVPTNWSYIHHPDSSTHVYHMSTLLNTFFETYCEVHFSFVGSDHEPITCCKCFWVLRWACKVTPDFQHILTSKLQWIAKYHYIWWSD